MSLADLREFSKTCPNPLDSDFPDSEKTSSYGGLFVKRHGSIDLLEQVMEQSIFTYANLQRQANAKYRFSSNAFATYPGAVGISGDDLVEAIPQYIPPAPVEEEFTVNLTEALVGWRRWRFTKETGSPVHGLRSLNSNTLWRPGDAYKAKCRVMIGMIGKKHSGVPGEKCSCGVYAVDSPNSLPEKNLFWMSTTKEFVVTGLVYGWGRYVRGEDGWRCEFAYPKQFHLKSYQAHLVEPLKAWHVPIIIDQPLRVYNSEDEGYSNGNWPEEAHRDLRAATEPDTEEG
jgi:hypothetical protein